MDPHLASKATVEPPPLTVSPVPIRNLTTMAARTGSSGARVGTHDVNFDDWQYIVDRGAAICAVNIEGGEGELTHSLSSFRLVVTRAGAALNSIEPCVTLVNAAGDGEPFLIEQGRLVVLDSPTQLERERDPGVAQLFLENSAGIFVKVKYGPFKKAQSEVFQDDSEYSMIPLRRVKTFREPMGNSPGKPYKANFTGMMKHSLFYQTLQLHEAGFDGIATWYNSGSAATTVNRNLERVFTYAELIIRKEANRLYQNDTTLRDEYISARVDYLKNLQVMMKKRSVHMSKPFDKRFVALQMPDLQDARFEEKVEDEVERVR